MSDDNEPADPAFINWLRQGPRDAIAVVEELERLRGERALVASYLREVGENECGFSQADCDELPERIERGLHMKGSP